MTNYLELPVGENSAGGIQRSHRDSATRALTNTNTTRNSTSSAWTATFIPLSHYPGDYGFIPSTLSEDGDPLDVLVLVDSPSFSGCVMAVRPIGLLLMLDQGVPDEKVLTVGRSNPRYADVWNYTECFPTCCGRLRTSSQFIRIWKVSGSRSRWHDAAPSPGSHHLFHAPL